MFDAAVTAEHVSVKIDDVARYRFFIGKQRIEIFGRDEILAFGLFRSREIIFPRDTEHIFFFDLRKRKAHFFKRRRRDPIQKIRLILYAVESGRNHCGFRIGMPKSRLRPYDARIVAGTKIIVVDALLLHAFEQRAEFNKTVAADARIRRPACAVLRFKIIDHLFLIFVFYVYDAIEHIVFFAEFFTRRYIFRFVETVTRRTQFFSVGQFGHIALPQRHRHSDDVAAFLLEKQGCNRRIDAA